MKTTTKTMNLYGWAFLIRAILFNVALVFGIWAAVKAGDGMTWMAITAITVSVAWLGLWDLVHLLWFKMTKNERMLYLAIRRHGHNIPEIKENEIDRKTGQKDTAGFFNDEDGGLEIKMAVNGTASLINVMIGFQWLESARKFNKTPQEFQYHLVAETNEK